MLGASYSLIAIGYTLIFGVLHLVHLASRGSYAVLVSDCAASHTAATLNVRFLFGDALARAAITRAWRARLSLRGMTKRAKSSVFSGFFPD